jgi:hypothetical protein
MAPVALYSFIALHSYADDLTQTEQGKAKLSHLYHEAAEHFKACNSEFKESGAATDERLKFDCSAAPFERPVYEVSGSLALKFYTDSLKLSFINYYSVLNRLGVRGRPRTVPTLLPFEAMKRARGYLEEWEIPASEGMTVTEISFDLNYGGCWRVTWTRVAEGYLWDGFNRAALENVVVVFHETLGLVLLVDDRFSPPPTRTSVGISREQAIQLASPCVSLVQKTADYRAARRDGFVANAVKSCELRVAIPNWILDPKKANWMPSEPPKETRLCWIVCFTTVDQKLGKRGLGEIDGQPIELECPDILIYLDAETGEVVGANFS